MFKPLSIKLTIMSSRQISYFIRFCGVNTPSLATLTLPINGNTYFGSIQKMIPLKYLRKIRIYGDNLVVDKLNSNQIQSLLILTVFDYLFENIPDLIIGYDNIAYIADLDNHPFVDEIYHSNPADFEMIFNYRPDFIDLAKIRRIFCDNNKDLILHSVVKKNDNLFPERVRKIWNYVAMNKVPIDAEEICKLVNFIADLSNKDFLDLIKIPELKGNVIYDYYLSSVALRRGKLKKYFCELILLINRENKTYNKLCSKQYSIIELKEKINRLELQIESLLQEKDTLSSDKRKQEELHVINSPEAWFVVSFCKNNCLYSNENLSTQEVLSALRKLQSTSKDKNESKAIEYYISIVEENQNITSNSRIYMMPN